MYYYTATIKKMINIQKNIKLNVKHQTHSCKAKTKAPPATIYRSLCFHFSFLTRKDNK